MSKQQASNAELDIDGMAFAQEAIATIREHYKNELGREHDIDLFKTELFNHLKLLNTDEKQLKDIVNYVTNINTSNEASSSR